MGEEKNIEQAVETFGKDVIEDVNHQSKMLGRTVSHLSNVSDTSNILAESLDKLKSKMKSLSPDLVDFSNTKKHLVFFNPVTKYFHKIEQEDGAIEKIMISLEKGRKILENDNITLQIEIDKLNEIISNMKNKYEEGVRWKNQLEQERKSKQPSDEEKFQNKVISPLERRLSDIQEMMIVKEQTSLAMEVVLRNNRELMRNIDRICSVTIAAFNTAAMVANTINHQKIILKKMDAIGKEIHLKSVTNRIMEKDLGNQKEKSSVDMLRAAFQDTYELCDEVQKENEQFFPENEIKVKEIKKRSEI